MREIPFFSVRSINKAEDFERFRHCKTYLESKSDECKDEIELLLACGYSVKSLNDLVRRIPLKYLSAIRVDLDALQFTLELGCEEFGKAIEIPFFPKVAGFRVIAAVYSQLELPENTSEAEAIEILKRFSGEEPFRTFIPVRDLKTTYVEPDGSAARGG